MFALLCVVCVLCLLLLLHCLVVNVRCRLCRCDCVGQWLVCVWFGVDVRACFVGVCGVWCLVCCCVCRFCFVYGSVYVYVPVSVYVVCPAPVPVHVYVHVYLFRIMFLVHGFMFLRVSAYVLFASVYVHLYVCGVCCVCFIVFMCVRVWFSCSS